MTTVAADSPVALCAALADDSRWAILQRISEQPASASELAGRLPISRQAIARHLSVLAEVGLVEAVPAGRQLRYEALGAPLTRLARDLDAIGRGWERRLERLKMIAESSSSGSSD